MCNADIWLNQEFYCLLSVITYQKYTSMTNPRQDLADDSVFARGAGAVADRSIDALDLSPGMAAAKNRR